MNVKKTYNIRDTNASDAIFNILHPNIGYREHQKRQGIIPTDFERKNKLELKKLAREKQQEQRKKEKELASQKAFKLSRFQRIKPRVFQSISESEKSLNVQERKQSKPFLRRREQETRAQIIHNEKALKNCVINAEEMDLRIPIRQKKNKLKAPVPTRNELIKRNAVIEKQVQPKPLDYVTANAWEVINKTNENDEEESSIKSYRHAAFGRVPSYLLQRQQQWKDEEAERIRQLPDPECPPGMRRMSEVERLHSLDLLQQSLEEHRRLWVSLPLRIETKRQIQRKETLENKMKELEAAILVFQKPKVFVPLNDQESNDLNCSAVAA